MFGFTLANSSVSFFRFLFCIAHFAFILVLGLYFGLIQPSASSLFTCECGYGLDTFNTHLIRCPFGDQRIVTHDAIQNIIYAFA
jgi:hypothetical protein